MEDLSPLLSRLAVRHALHTEFPGTYPEPKPTTGVVILFDISQFTPLTTRYAGRGMDGLDDLSALINEYFSALLSPVHEMGGDVLAFFGDAALVLFSEDGEDVVTFPVVERALACALAARDRCHDYPTDDGSHLLGLKTTVGAGGVEVCTVQANGAARQVLVYGDAVRQIGAAEHLGVPGQIVLSPQAARLIPASSFELRVSSSATLLVKRASGSAPVAGVHEPREVLAHEIARPYLDGRLADRLRVVDKIWMAEFRTITSLFINVELNDARPESPTVYQELFEEVAAHIDRHGGAILSFGVEDKGIVFSCAFGVPGHSVEDGPSSSLQAAWQARMGVRRLGHRPSLGCATGRQYFGPLGDQRRFELKLLSETVNLAARFAGVCASDVLCDRTTAQGSKLNSQEVTELPPFQLKGFAGLVDAFRCAEVSDSRHDSGCIGRKQAKAAVETALHSLGKGQGGCVLISGEAGIGKSALIGFANARAAAHGAVGAVGVSSEATRDLPYNAWRSVIEEVILGRFLRVTPEARDGAPEDPEIPMMECMRLLPLLSDIVEYPVEENETTVELTGAARVRATRRLLVDLFVETSRQTPLVISLDNAHWFDSASWSLVEDLRRSPAAILLIVATRSWEVEQNSIYGQLRGDGSVTVQDLSVLDALEVEELLRSMLGGLAVDERVVSELRRRGGGHPFFTRELYHSLCEKNALVVSLGTCCLSSPHAEVGLLAPTETVASVIMTRVDRLSALEQMILKVASAIGERVALPLLRHAVEDLGIGEDIDEVIEKLRLRDFLNDIVRGELLVFKHAITRDVVYALLTQSQRVQIHGALVRAYGARGGSGSSNVSAVVATHCVNAEMYEQGVLHFEIGARKALASGAYREAFSHASRAQQLAIEYALDTDVSRLAYWELIQGEAEFQMGRLDAARRHFERGLVAVGVTGNPTNAGIVRDLVRCIARQMLRHLLRDRKAAGAAVTLDEERPEASRVVVLLLERLARMYYFSGELAPLVRYVMLMLDRSEQGPPSLELAKSYAGVTLIAGFSRYLGPVSRWYARRAREVAATLERKTAVGEIELILGTEAVGRAEWDVAGRSVGKALTLFREANDAQGVGHCRTVKLEIALYQGRP